MMKAEVVVRSEHLRTVAVVVPRSKEEIFTETYQSFHTNVLKHSDYLLREDMHHTLHRIVLLTADAVPAFTAKASELGCMVRPFDATEEEHKTKRNELKALVEKKDTLEEDLHEWCQKREHEVQTQRYHLLMLRQAAESAMSYGTRKKFMSIVVCVPPGHEEQTRTILEQVPDTSGGLVLNPDEEALYSSLFPSDERDNVPYVSFQFQR
ncbi:V-type proton ATPase subunit C [Triticum aestivum]|uniref:V-type proton ATPase subunit C n=1 Tax=Triticum aestivum TaxID=4565 RepID=UPI001D00F064|nr:V-type proton ATPase subunit C-like [Triticum aestivum]